MGLFSSIGKIVSKAAPFIGAATGQPWLASLGTFANSAGGSALIEGGLSLLGGKGGKKTGPTTNLVALRNQALKAGFNPLTALMATGGQGFNTVTEPKLSTSAFIANALKNGSDAYRDQVFKDQQVMLDQQKIDALKTEAANIGNYRQSPLGGAPAIQTTTNEKTGQQPHLAGFEKAEKAPVENVPLTFQYRTGANGSREWVGLNPDAWEIGLGELAGGALVHGGAYLYSHTGEIIDKGKKTRKEINDVFNKRKPRNTGSFSQLPLRDHYGLPGSRNGF